MQLRRTHIALILGSICSLVFLYYALRNVDLLQITAAAEQVNYFWVLPFLLSLGIFYYLKALRWQWLLSPITIAPIPRLFAPMMIGYAANVVLPAQLGEIVRVVHAADSLKISRGAALSSIALERAFDLIAVLIFLGLALISGAQISPHMLSAGYFIIIASTLIVIAAAACVFRTRTCLAIAQSCSDFLPKTWQAFLLRSIRATASGLQSLRYPKLILSIFWSSLLQWSCILLCAGISLLAFAQQPPLSALFLLVSFMAVGVSLPSGPGHIGNIQLAYTLALSPYGFDPAIAFAASVFYHLLAYLSVLFSGMFYLHRTGKSMSQLVESTETRT